MKQTTLFGAATSTATTPTQTNAVNGNKTMKKTPQSSRNALSDYFKFSNRMNSNSDLDEEISEVTILRPSQDNLKVSRSLLTSEVKNSPVSKITEEISIISFESPMASSRSTTNTTALGINTYQINTVTPETQHQNSVSKSSIKNGNQITSHFLPKKLSNLDAFNLSFDEDEKSLNKNKTKIQTKEIFVEGNNLNFENPCSVLMISEFFYDFHDMFGIKQNDGWFPPNFYNLCQALQSCTPKENFPTLAPLLIRLMGFLVEEPLPYFHENIDNLNTVCNVSAVLWLYFYQKKNNEVLEKIQTDFYCLPCDVKIFIFNLLLENVISKSRFHTFYDEKLARIEEMRRNLKFLKEDLCNFNREQSALKLYRTEKTRDNNESIGLSLDINRILPTCEFKKYIMDRNNFTDKENVNFNSNHQTNEEDIDTRLQTVSYKFNQTQREVLKLQRNLDRNESFTISKKKLGTDSFGRNYYILKSYSETAVLVEIDESKKEFFEKLEREPNGILSTASQIENINEITELNKDIECINSEESKSKELQDNEVANTQNSKFSHTLSGDSIGTTSIVWMEYNTESQLKDLIKFLRTDNRGKKFHNQIKETLSSLINTPDEEKLECIEEPYHFLRSKSKDKANPIEFTCEEFVSQLIDFGEDLLSSGLVSTQFDYITWIDTLSNVVFTLTTEDCQELTNKLASLIDCLIDSCKSNIDNSIYKSYLPQTTPTLSRLYLLLDYYERTIDTVDSCYGKSCRKCLKKNIWYGSKYCPLFICKECFKAFHLTCQDPPLKDIPSDHCCNQCTNPPTHTTNTFYRSKNLRISDDESSSESEEIIQRCLRPRITYTAYNSSPPSYSKFEKKRRAISSDSEDQSPYARRKGLRSMAYQPPKKKLTHKTNGYTSKLRSACT